MRKVVNIRRYIAGVSAIVLAGVALLPALVPQKASAYGLIQSRKITMSSSANGSTAAGQDVTYEVSFNVATDASDIAGVVVDFCSDSPIIGEDCTAPTGFDLDPANLALTLNAGLTGFTVDTTNSEANMLVITGSAYNPGAAENIRFTLGTSAANDGVDNPENANTVFYARIITFTTAAGAQAYDSDTVNANNPGAEPPVIDAGGVALSTASQVTIQSKVQERLTFCIYTGAGPCPGSMSNPVTLGDTNGVLDPNTSYTTATSANGNPKFGLASNAGGDVAVHMKGGTLKRTQACADGTNQPCSINPIGGTAAAPTTSTEQFGVSMVNAGANISASAPYTIGGNYAFDDNNTTGTQSTYGDQIASMVASGEQSAELQFVGNIANTTESGIYTTTLTFIATGTY